MILEAVQPHAVFFGSQTMPKVAEAIDAVDMNGSIGELVPGVIDAEVDLHNHRFRRWRTFFHHLTDEEVPLFGLSDGFAKVNLLPDHAARFLSIRTSCCC